MALRSCQLADLAEAFQAALQDESATRPLGGLIGDGPIGVASQFLVDIIVDAGEQFWGSQAGSGELSPAEEIIAGTGLPLGLASPLARVLREQLESVRQAVLGEAPPPRVMRAVRRTLGRIKVQRGRLRYRMQIGGLGVGPVVTIFRSDERRHWGEVRRFGGEAAVFLQRLAAAMREMTAYVSYKETVDILVGTPEDRGRKLASIAHDAVRKAVYRKLPEGIDHRDLVQNIRHRGYKLCEGVDISGELRAEFEIPAWVQSRSRETQAANIKPDVDQQVIEMLRERRSFEAIKFELELTDEELEKVKTRLAAKASTDESHLIP